jgi:flavin-dependent dehydrogenase
MKPQVIIIGAGPAGSSLAIRLANSGFRVLLIEREKFPRQKLCGEFISPECFEHFRQLGVLDAMMAAGGNTISETVFFAPSGAKVSVPSKWFNKEAAGALGLSRAEMDFCLLNRARSLGVQVLEETQVVGLLWDKNQVCGVKAREKNNRQTEFTADLTIDASGRSSALSRFVIRKKGETLSHVNQLAVNKSQSSQSKLIGFKAHLKNARIELGVCEIYFFRGGYGGLCQVENDFSNHCFLIKANVARECGNDPERVLHEIVFKNKRAAETLKQSQIIGDWLAVSVDSFGKKNLAPAPRLLSIGDAAAFIDPFTGSGMLMALESSKIVSQAILMNDADAEKTCVAYQKLYDQKFKTRLSICSIFRRAAFASNLTTLGVRTLNLSRTAQQILAQATRH